MTILDRLRRWFQRPKDPVLGTPDEAEQMALTTPSQKGALLDEGKVPPPTGQA